VSKNSPHTGFPTRVHPDQTNIIGHRGRGQLWIQALRVHQWAKNFLIFVPLLAAHQFGDARRAEMAALAFVAFSLVASSAYLVNDVIDRGADRHHPTKRSRPFASGELSVVSGIVGAAALALVSVVVALQVTPPFTVALLIYLLLANAYSFWLRGILVLDVIVLASLYTLRIIAGSAATGIAASFWLLAFSIFIFFSLALAKRYSEVDAATGQLELVGGRAYHSEDPPVLLALGASSGLTSAMVLALYLDSRQVVASYREPLWLWLAPPALLYWIARLWMKTHRGELRDDPLLFAITDPQSLVLAAILIALFAAAILGLRFW
jgi:4-hydroxybenzoate polyprenyltransferase